MGNNLKTSFLTVRHASVDPVLTRELLSPSLLLPPPLMVSILSGSWLSTHLEHDCLTCSVVVWGEVPLPFWSCKQTGNSVTCTHKK